MTARVEVTVRYRRGHTLTRPYVPADMFCPSCAGRTVWVEDGQGDYYQGPTHVCVSCGCEFCIQGPTKPYDGPEPHETVIQQTVHAIRLHLGMETEEAES